jgi:hypothetical protein
MNNPFLRSRLPPQPTQSLGLVQPTTSPAGGSPLHARRRNVRASFLFLGSRATQRNGFVEVLTAVEMPCLAFAKRFSSWIGWCWDACPAFDGRVGGDLRLKSWCFFLTIQRLPLNRSWSWTIKRFVAPAPKTFLTTHPSWSYSS